MASGLDQAFSQVAFVFVVATIDNVVVVIAVVDNKVFLVDNEVVVIVIIVEPEL